MRRNEVLTATALMLLVTVGGCRAVAKPETTSRCAVLANVGDYAVTPEGVRELRATTRPSPAREQALTLAIDVRVSEWEKTGEVGALSWPEAVRAYRADLRARTQEADLAAVSGAFEDARQRLGVRVHHCASS